MVHDQNNQLIYFSTTFKDTIYQDQNQKPTSEINKKCFDIKAFAFYVYVSS